MKNSLIERATKILNENFQKGGYTIPSKNLYPFQFLEQLGIAYIMESIYFFSY